MATSVTLPEFPTTADVLASLQSALKTINGLLTNLNTGGVTETYLEACALLTGSDASSYPGVIQQGAYELLKIVQRSAYILTATGTALDAKAADVGVTRKPASNATGTVQFFPVTTSNVDQIIYAGALVASESADPTVLPSVYATTKTFTVPAGANVANPLSSPQVVVKAVNAGTASNQAALGAVNVVVSGATGFTVVSTSAMVGGLDVEDDDAPNGGLRARALAAIPNASQCTLSAIELAARSYPGVTYAVATDANLDSTIPVGLVHLYIDDGSGNLAGSTNNAIIATLQADLNSGLFRAGGIEVVVQGSVIVLIATVTLAVKLNALHVATVAPAATIVAQIRAGIFNYINSVGVGGEVLVSEIVRIVKEVPGVSDVPPSTVLINARNENFTPMATNSPRLANLSDITVTTSVVDF